MTTDDAPRPALDAATFRDLLDALSDARAASAVAEREDDEEWARRSHEREDVLRGRLIVTYDTLLAAAAERDKLAGEIARLRRAVALALDGPSDGEIGMETTLGRLNRIERQLRAAVAPQEGDGNGR